MTEPALPVVVQNPLTERERYHLERFLRERQPALGSSLQAEMFELFLSGETLAGVARMNRGIDLGAIVHAATEGDWFRRRQEYRDSLLDGVRDRALQAHREAIQFSSLLLQAAHKQHGDKIRRFLQTGDPNDLGSMSVQTVDSYRKAAELFQRLIVPPAPLTPPPPPSGATAAERADKAREVLDSTAQPVVAQPDKAGLLARPLTAEEAEAFLRAIQEG